MPANKTRQTEANVDDYLAAIEDDGRRMDCQALAKLMSKVSKQPARMWGPNIVGFGVHRYKYESGREGEICAVGFSSRKSDISLYLKASSAAHAELLPKLGKHKMGKGCLYVRKLADVDTQVLEQVVAVSLANLDR